MGVYNEIKAKCASCGGQIEFQYKDGDYGVYEVPEVPMKIAIELNGRTTQCDFCNHLNRFVLKNQPDIEIR